MAIQAGCIAWYVEVVKCRIIILLALLLLSVLPLAGGFATGLPEDFFSFPPLVHQQPGHVSFSFAVWMLFAAIGLLAAGVVLLPRRFGFDPLPPCPGSGPPRPCAAGEPVPPAGPGAPPASRFPLHGKLGLTLLLASWILA